MRADKAQKKDRGGHGRLGGQNRAGAIVKKLSLITWLHLSLLVERHRKTSDFLRLKRDVTVLFVAPFHIITTVRFIICYSYSNHIAVSLSPR